MDKSTAQAITELAETGRLSDESTEVVRSTLGLEVDEKSGLVVPKANTKGADKDADKGADKGADNAKGTRS